MNLLAKSLKGRIRRQSVCAAVVAGLFATVPACHIPNIFKPQAWHALPGAYDRNNNPSQAELSTTNSAQLGWCQFFDDPVLQNLIGDSLAGNQELKILAQDIRIANNEIMARRGAIFPFFGLGTSAGIEKSSRFTRDGAVEDQLLGAPGDTFPEPLPNFLMAADMTWEIDIWRKLRNRRDAASLRYLGTQAGRNYVVTRLVAEVAENYYELLALDNRLIILEKTIQIQQESLKAAKALKAAARGTELAVQRFQAEVQKNQSERLKIIQEIVEVENRINFIAGRFPQQIARPSVDYINLMINTLSVGVPSEQLLYRCDIRQAEREVQAAGLDVMAARAEFYPSLVLTAGVGYEAFNTKYLLNSPESLIYGAAGGLVVPIINRSAIKAEYLNANARQLQAIYDYQQTILRAHIEVINQLSKVDNFNQSIEIKKQQLRSLEASVENATKLFQNARGEYIDVLLSQRELMEARMALVETKQQELTAVIRAYQALGGGGNAGDFSLDQLESTEPLPEPEEDSNSTDPTKDQGSKKPHSADDKSSNKSSSDNAGGSTNSAQVTEDNQPPPKADVGTNGKN